MNEVLINDSFIFYKIALIKPVRQYTVLWAG